MFILVVGFFYSHFVFLSACLSCKPSTLVKDILISADLRTGDRHLIKTVVIKLKGHEGSPRSLRFIRNSQIWYTSYQIPWNNMANLQTTPIVNKPLFEVNKNWKRNWILIKFLTFYDPRFERHFRNDVSWFKCTACLDVTMFKIMFIAWTCTIQSN